MAEQITLESGLAFAYAEDNAGDERFTLRIKDLRTGAMLPDVVKVCPDEPEWPIGDRVRAALVDRVDGEAMREKIDHDRAAEHAGGARHQHPVEIRRTVTAPQLHTHAPSAGALLLAAS